MKRISAVEARQRLGALLDDVNLAGAEYVIERDSRPTAIVIPLEAYQSYREARRRAFDRVEAVRARLAEEIPAEDLERAIDEAVAEVRSGAE